MRFKRSIKNELFSPPIFSNLKTLYSTSHQIPHTTTMAEEDVHYASKVGTNKRKYKEEQTISRRPTGFSAMISS